MKICELYPDFEPFLLSLKGIKAKDEQGGRVYYLVSKPFAAVFENEIHITAKADYNETIRVLHVSISKSNIFGERWNSVGYDPTIPYEVVKDMAERGYRMTYASLPKKVQREIEEYYYG